MITESRLNAIIAESIQKVLKEDFDTEGYKKQRDEWMKREIMRQKNPNMNAQYHSRPKMKKASSEPVSEPAPYADIKSQSREHWAKAPRQKPMKGAIS